MVNFKIQQELEIREKEEECKRKREVMASVLEKRAEKSRKTSIAAEKIYNQFVCVRTN